MTQEIPFSAGLFFLIQTLYLAIAAILIGSLFFSKMATSFGGGESEIMYYERWYYLALLIMTFVANGICLLSFKARILQMRVAVIAAILLIAFQAWLGADYLAHRKDDIVFSFTAVFPLIAAILDLLAAKNIALDEAMVQSASRLRSSKRSHRK